MGRSGVLACLEAIKGEPDEDGPCYIDFQKIVPMPAILEGTVSGSDADLGCVLLGDEKLGEKMLSYDWVKEKGITDLEALRKYLREHHPEAEEAGRRSLQAEQETGCRDWYEWRAGKMTDGFTAGHWGTKWNACYFGPLEDATDTRADIAFCTAWSPPAPVIMELSRQFPKLTFTLKYWEGGCGFRGMLRVKAGRVSGAATYDYSGPRGG
jgi:hypothetical protein